MEVQQTTSPAMKRAMLIINMIILAIGSCGGPMVMRLYFLKGGERIWFSAWLETGGWPFMFIPLVVAYTQRLKIATSACPAKLVLMKPRVFLAAAVIGVLTGLDDYIYANGVAKLPVSTSSLIIATQLAFTAGWAYVLVKQKFTAYSLNAVVLLTVAAAVLGMHSGSDRPAGETNTEYWIGFFFVLGAAALYGFILPLVEVVYQRADQALSYALVLEIQLVMCFFATAFCTVGMIINKDFQAISREAKAYELGENKYYLVVVFCAITWQCFFLGAIGIIFYASSLLSGIMIAVLIPFTEVLGVIFYHENFGPEKGVSLALSLWGFISYFYGERKQEKKKKNLIRDEESALQTELTQRSSQY